MKIFISIFTLVLLIGCSQPKAYPLIKTSHSPTEKEVNDFIRIGLDKQTIVAKFGEPLIKEPEQNGVETYYYPEPPSTALTDEKFVYGGFQIYFTKDKVSGFDIIHKDVRVRPK